MFDSAKLISILTTSALIYSFLSGYDGKYLYKINFRGMCSGTTDRNPGKMSQMPSFANIHEYQYFHNISNTKSRKCGFECMQCSQCIQAIYKSYYKNINRGDCFFYNQSFQLNSSLHGDVLFQWKECEANDSTICLDTRTPVSSSVMKSNRCPGVWIRYMNYQFIDQSRILYKNGESLYVQLSRAQEECLKSFSCGGIQSNRLNRTFGYQLYRAWPYTLESNLKRSHKSNDYTAFIWKCGNCEERFDNTTWKKSETPTIPSQDTTYLASFYTAQAEECRLECLRINRIYLGRRQCDTVYYNETINLCLIKKFTDTGVCSSNVNIDIITNGSLMTEYTLLKKPTDKYEGYDTHSLINDNDIEMRYSKKYKKFHCICFNEDLTVYNDKCDQPDTTSSIHKSLKDIALLQVNEKPKRLHGKYFHRFFTGYEYIWISSSSPNIIPCELKNCALFSAEILEPFKSKDIQLVTRDKWEAQKPRKTYLLHSVRNVIMEATVLPRCGCIGLDHCTDELRSIQIYCLNKCEQYDIKYSFLVDDVGRIYEGTGWKYRSSAVQGYIYDSITIAFIGDFMENAPTLAALNSVKRFLHDALVDKKVRGDYNLYHRTDLFAIKEGTFKNHTSDRKIKLILSNWRHYKGQMKPEYLCDLEWKIISISWTVSLFFIIIVSLGVAYRTGCIHRGFCKTTRQLLYDISEASSVINLFLLNLDQEECRLVNSELNGNEKVKVFLKRTNFTINLNISTFCFAHIGSNSVKCSCLLMTKALYQLLQANKANAIVEHLQNSYFLKKCPLKTVVLIILPRDQHEFSYIMILHGQHLENIIRFVGDMLMKRLCLCRKFMIDRSSLRTNNLTNVDTTENIAESKSILSLNELQSLRLEGQRLITRNHDVKFQDILIREENNDDEK